MYTKRDNGYTCPDRMTYILYVLLSTFGKSATHSHICEIHSQPRRHFVFRILKRKKDASLNQIITLPIRIDFLNNKTFQSFTFMNRNTVNNRFTKI